MSRLFSLIYGLCIYALFLVTIGYAVFFAGDFVVSKTIDKGAASPMSTAILVDTLLLGSFAVQHSVMARQGFKRMWTRMIPEQLERSTYVLVASVILLLVFWQWRPLPDVVWEVHGVAAVALWIAFVAGWALLLLSTFLIDHFELFGVKQVWRYCTSQRHRDPVFRTPALYKMVRHPLYLGFVIAFWSAPRMTVGHLIFSIATTGYILLGIFFEERDLLKAHGDSYRRYRDRVPMLLPFLGGSKNAEALPPVARMSRGGELK